MKRRKFDAAAVPGKAAGAVDDRLQVATPLRKLLNKVFPDHWSFLLGEIALFSFIVVLLTGVYLTFFFDPSLKEVTYDGSYAPLRGTHMSAAYATALDISFDVRGGLIMRQMHHWGALMFMAAIAMEKSLSGWWVFVAATLYWAAGLATGSFRGERARALLAGMAACGPPQTQPAHGSRSISAGRRCDGTACRRQSAS